VDLYLLSSLSCVSICLACTRNHASPYIHISATRYACLHASFASLDDSHSPCSREKCVLSWGKNYVKSDPTEEGRNTHAHTRVSTVIHEPIGGGSLWKERVCGAPPQPNEHPPQPVHPAVFSTSFKHSLEYGAALARSSRELKRRAEESRGPRAPPRRFAPPPRAPPCRSW